jgi:hypothetical protein
MTLRRIAARGACVIMRYIEAVGPTVVSIVAIGIGVVSMVAWVACEDGWGSSGSVIIGILHTISPVASIVARIVGAIAAEGRVVALVAVGALVVAGGAGAVAQSCQLLL